MSDLSVFGGMGHSSPLDPSFFLGFKNVTLLCFSSNLSSYFFTDSSVGFSLSFFLHSPRISVIQAIVLDMFAIIQLS